MPTKAGIKPPMNKAAIDTPVTAPMVIKTKLGGMVSLMAPEAANKATKRPGSAPRCFISGNKAGATAAMSAALEPEMPDTKYMAANNTYCKPPRKWPKSEARNCTMALAKPVTAMNAPKNTNKGTDSKIRCDMPSSMRLTTMVSGVLVENCK